MNNKGHGGNLGEILLALAAYVVGLLGIGTAVIYSIFTWKKVFHSKFVRFVVSGILTVALGLLCSSLMEY